jgi:polyisoprenoid-binding protein YceI
MKRVNEQVSNVNKKISNNAYKNVIQYNEAVAKATRLVKNSFNSASVRGAFAFDGAVSIFQTIFQELVK